jgi:hypothetical protein
MARETFVSPSGVMWRPSVAPKGSGADWDNARTWFRERSIDEWVAVLADGHTMGKILADLLREAQAEAQRDAGKVKIGRRPRVANGTMADVHALMETKYATIPFAQSLPELIGERSLRAFAQRAGMPHQTIQKMISGEARLEMWRLEALAKAGRVHPSYFMEWREGHVLTYLAELLASRPNLSIKASQALTRAASS